MNAAKGLTAVLLVVLVLPAVAGAAPGTLQRVNRRLCGKMIDYTHNHGADRRIWSCALQERRDLYVYVPPGFDPCHRYPILLYLHGNSQDEQFFLRNQIELFDKAIAGGRLPPVIIAVPDGSLQGRPSFFRSASFFTNSCAGAYEDYLLQDVWGFVTRHYPIRPEREAHVLVGASMGGGAAFALAIKHRDCFGVAVGFFPALNLRWVDCRERYMGNFDPCCWCWRTKLRPWEVVGRVFGVITVHYGMLTTPLFGKGPCVLEHVSRFNPIEMLNAYDVQPGQLEMFVAYAGKDEFNMDAQVESFLYCARRRGLCVGVAYDPKGRHNLRSGRRLFPPAIAWLAPRLAADPRPEPEEDLTHGSFFRQ